MYKPERPWTVSGNLIYNLKQDGRYQGYPNIVNDVAITVYNRSITDKDMERITKAIAKALNEEFAKDIENL